MPALVAVEVATEANIPLQIEDLVSLNLDKIKEDVLSKNYVQAKSLPTNSNVEHSSIASKEILEEFKDSLENDSKNIDNGHIIIEYLVVNNDSIEQDSLEYMRSTSDVSFSTSKRSSNESLFTEKERNTATTPTNSHVGNNRNSLIDASDDDKEANNQILPGRSEHILLTSVLVS